MNHYYPAQKKKDLRWHFIWQNDDIKMPAGYCPDHEEGHETRDEAIQCFGKYLVDMAREVTYDQFSDCMVEGCDHKTNQAYEFPHVLSPVDLCPVHFNKDTLREVYRPPEYIMSSS